MCMFGFSPFLNNLAYILTHSPKTASYFIPTCIKVVEFFSWETRERQTIVKIPICSAQKEHRMKKSIISLASSNTCRSVLSIYLNNPSTFHKIWIPRKRVCLQYLENSIIIIWYEKSHY